MSLLTRRLMMMAGARREEAKYPLVDGRHDFSDGSYVEVKNGNHVKISIVSGYGFFINVSNINQNSNAATNNSNINNLPEWFSLKKGDVCELTVKNIVKSNINSTYASNFRFAGTSISSGFGYAQAGSVEDKTVKITLNRDESYGCYFFYITTLTEFECDLEFVVNGERYI